MAFVIYPETYNGSSTRIFSAAVCCRNRKVISWFATACSPKEHACQTLPFRPTPWHPTFFQIVLMRCILKNSSGRKIVRRSVSQLLHKILCGCRDWQMHCRFFRHEKGGDLITKWIYLYLKISTTRIAGGLLWPCKGLLSVAPKDAGFHCVQAQCHCRLGYPLKGSWYSRVLNLSCKISCFSCCWIYFLIVASLSPTVLT